MMVGLVLWGVHTLSSLCMYLIAFPSPPIFSAVLSLGFRCAEVFTCLESDSYHLDKCFSFHTQMKSKKPLSIPLTCFYCVTTRPKWKCILARIIVGYEAIFQQLPHHLLT